ncbi:MAG TPA: ACP S-malonyltransferase [Fibrobacteria bacterium]|nr:ACP S-malonyltransferase [Fibrobacteria bacterium]
MKTIFLFPGQGSQYVGMGKVLADSHPKARRLLEEADDVLGFALSRILFEGPEEDLKATQNTQPALFVTSQLAALVLAEAGVTADFVAGHSLGEYSALAAMGALSFADGLRLVRLRGELMAEAGVRRPGAMAAVLGLEPGPLEEALKAVHGVVVPANFNSPGQIVISGEVEAVEKGMEAALSAGAKKVVRLPVSGAFHSPLMEYALEGLREGLAKAVFGAASAPVIANVDALPHVLAMDFPGLLERQLVSPVRWTDSMRKAIDLGAVRGVEVGSGKVLMGLMRGIDRNVPVTPVETVEAARTLVA